MHLLSIYAQKLAVEFRAVSYVEQPREDALYDYTPEFSSIGYILGGEGSIVVEGVDLRPEAGDLYLLPAKTQQSYSSFSDNPYHKYYCHFTATVAGRNFFELVKVPLRIHIGQNETVRHVFEELCALQAEAHPLAGLRMRSLVEQLLYLYLTEGGTAQTDPAPAKKQEAIEETLLYIEEHLSEDLSVAHLAERCFFNSNYFARLFKENTGETPKHYILHRRNQKAIDLLLTTSLGIADIAARTGFDNASYFSNTFKKLNGLAPGEFRKLSTGKEI